MRDKRLQGRITAGRWTLPVVILVCTLCWVLTSFLLPVRERLAEVSGASSLWPSVHTLLTSYWSERLTSFLVYALIGYFLIELNNRFTIIRMRASVQTSIYFLLITVCPEMHLLHAGDVVAIVSLISIYFLFKSYQKPHASSDLYYSFLFLGAGSILFPQLTFFSVLWLLEAYRFQSLTVRSFFAAILGWTTSYWLLFGHAFFYGRMELFRQPFTELASFEKAFQLQQLPSWELAMLGYLFLLFVVSTGHYFAASYQDKIRTRTYLQCLVHWTFCIFLFIALQPRHCFNLLPSLIVCNSILTGHLFVLTNSKVSNMFFIVSMFCLICLFGFNIWILL